MNRDRPHRRTLSPRLVVLGVLISSFVWALVFPLRLTRPPSAAFATAYGVGLALFAVAMALVLRAAVSPDQPVRARLWSIIALVGVSLALWLPAYAWAEPGKTPWAWLAGFAVGAVVLAQPAAGAGVAAGLGVMAVLGALAFDGSAVVNLALVLGLALVLWLAGLVLVWLLRLLSAAEAGREAEAGLAIAQERLRVSRELHDVLGHRLGIIALKAELAADLAATDPARSAAENEEIRAIAATTLAEARRAVHGETVADLATQVASAELVLSSAGIATTVDVDAAQLPAATSRLLAAVVREAVTNILRHSAARTVSIGFDGTLVIVNDGADRPGDGSSSGTGLAALAARCASTGARLVARAIDGGRFEVRVELAP
jgi:two-component system sensor histidine kinase DesK